MALGICPNGHPLRPGQVLVGWSPCTCAPAWGEHKGHRTVQCLDCRTELGEEMVRYHPTHAHGEGHPNRR